MRPLRQRFPGRKPGIWLVLAILPLIMSAVITIGPNPATASTPTQMRQTPPGTSAGPRPAAPRSHHGAIGALTLVFESVGSIGYTAAGTAMRNLGYGSISIDGVPKGATVQSATLIWDVIYTEGDYYFRQGNFNGTPITGQFVEYGESPCWPLSNSDDYTNFSYEADVTNLVSGNGTYNLTGFATGESDGADPWENGSEPPYMEGATLLVVYQQDDLPRTAVELNMGAFMSTAGNSASAIITGFQASPDPQAKTTYIVADGQEEGNTATFDGTTLDDVSFPGADHQSVPNYSMGNLWDTVTKDVSQYVKPGDGDANVSVTGYQDCVVWVGQVLSVTLPPQIQLGALRFAAANADDDGTPGLPVIKDDRPKAIEDHSSGPKTCHGLASPRTYDYLDCTVPSTNTPDKQWPVIYVAKKKLTINRVVFFSSGPLKNPMVSATGAMTGGEEMTLPPTKLTQTPTDQGYQLTGSNLTFSGNLPPTPSPGNFYFTWTISDAGVQVPAGSTVHPVYLTAAPYVAPSDTVILPPYLTLIDIGTVWGADQKTPKAVFRAIWQEFATRDIAHPILDRVTGEVTDGPDIKYYDNGYTTIGDWWTKLLSRCPAPYAALSMNSGHCGNWAQFLANILAYQGIHASYVDLGDDPDFYPGPEPFRRLPAQAYAYMLIGPSLWSFNAKNESGPYAYSDPVSVSGTTMTVTPTHVKYNPSRAPIAQGLVTTPPELFNTGDHAIVRTPWGLVDPSYGMPQGTTPYKTMTAYEKASIAGFAVFYYETSRHDFTPVQLPHTPADIVKFCAVNKCEFRAVPNADSGAP